MGGVLAFPLKPSWAFQQHHLHQEARRSLQYSATGDHLVAWGEAVSRGDVVAHVSMNRHSGPETVLCEGLHQTVGHPSTCLWRHIEDQTMTSVRKGTKVEVSAASFLTRGRLPILHT